MTSVYDHMQISSLLDSLLDIHGTSRLGRPRQGVEQRRGEHQGRAQEEERPGGEVLQQPRDHAAHQDRHRGGEPLEDAVCVLDGGGDHEPPAGLEADDGDDSRGVAVEGAEQEELSPVVRQHGGQGEQEGEQAQLEVPR